MSDDQTVRITLPGAPRGKGRPRSRIAATKTGQQFVQVYTDSDTRKYENALGFAAMAAMRGRKPFDCPLEVTVVAYFDVPKSWSKTKTDSALLGRIRPVTKPDADNIEKSALDACKSIAFADDSQVVDVHTQKFYSLSPRLEITIKPTECADIFTVGDRSSVPHGCAAEQESPAALEPASVSYGTDAGSSLEGS